MFKYRHTNNFKSIMMLIVKKEQQKIEETLFILIFFVKSKIFVMNVYVT